THHGEHQTSLLPGRLQILCAPLQYGIADGIQTVTAPQELEGARAQPGIYVDRHHVTPVAGSTEERQREERVLSIPVQGGTTSVDRFPLPFDDRVEALERLADVGGDVLTLARHLTPECRHRDALGGQRHRRSGPEADGARYDWVATVE